MATQTRQIPPHFIVIVPGYMGSKLRDKTTGKVVWVDFSSIPFNPLQWGDWLDHLLKTMAYPNDNLEPAGIMDQVIFVPPWAKQEHYNRLIEAFQIMGYQADPARYPENELDVYGFGYDWRQDNRISARQLGAAIERWRAYHPGAQVWLIAHSNGGLVARWYIEKEGGKEHVGRLFLMASPWDGTVKAMRLLFDGLEMLFRQQFNLFNLPERSRAMLRTFPSIYQLIPHQDPFLRGLNNEPVDPFNDLGWLEDEQHRQLLLDAQRFNQELGTTTSVETLCFFGRKRPTTTYGIVRPAAMNRWSDVTWSDTEAGDGTLSERTAVHPNAQQILPFVAGHGDIYVDPAVLTFLQWELMGKYRKHERASLLGQHVKINFAAERDAYRPGETIALWATAHKVKDDSPITRARIEAQLLWRQALPGAQQVIPPQNLPQVRLQESIPTPGRYESNLVAPDVEGYYLLQASVKVAGQPTHKFEELIVIET
ncbi:MAG: hypothetical protein A2Z04_01315 [Chloroflexi bacterium RBG_16_57_9]|nr:MAG: hypothetical protein A2Z04_01315 [Chloroflexi bacterium RBG_16_57_9]